MPLLALVSELQVQEIRELQLLLESQVALVVDEKLVETVGDMLVDLANPTLHVVGRFLLSHQRL